MNVIDLIRKQAAGQTVTDDEVSELSDALIRFSCRALSGDDRDKQIAAYRELRRRAKGVEKEAPSPKPVYRSSTKGASLGCPKCGGPSSISGEPCDSCWDGRPRTSTKAVSKQTKTGKRGESYAQRNRRERREDDERFERAAIEGEVVDSRIWKDGEGWSAPLRAKITLEDGRTYRLKSHLGGLAKPAIKERLEEPTTIDWELVD